MTENFSEVQTKTAEGPAPINFVDAVSKSHDAGIKNVNAEFNPVKSQPKTLDEIASSQAAAFDKIAGEPNPAASTPNASVEGDSSLNFGPGTPACGGTAKSPRHDDPGLGRLAAVGVGGLVADVGRFSIAGPAVKGFGGESSFIRGFAVGGLIEGVEAQFSKKLEPNHPWLAAAAKPTGVEALMVGFAAGVGAGTWKARAALVGGAMVASKAFELGEYTYEHLKGK